MDNDDIVPFRCVCTGRPREGEKPQNGGKTHEPECRPTAQRRKQNLEAFEESLVDSGSTPLAFQLLLSPSWTLAQHLMCSPFLASLPSWRSSLMLLPPQNTSQEPSRPSPASRPAKPWSWRRGTIGAKR